MPMPTRRAIRPDGKHHRNARRRRIVEGGQEAAPRGFTERIWMCVAAVAFVIFLACLIDSWMAAGRASSWVRPVGWTALLIVVMCVGELCWQTRD